MREQTLCLQAAALDGKNSERDALQAYGNLQVSVAGLQEENKRLQQKLMRVEAAAARASELEAAMQRLTQVRHAHQRPALHACRTMHKLHTGL